MQLTLEMMIPLIASAFVGGTVAYFGNRIVNSEHWGHIRRHCDEIKRIELRQKGDADAQALMIDGLRSEMRANDEAVGASFRRVYEKHENHRDRLVALETWRQMTTEERRRRAPS